MSAVKDMLNMIDPERSLVIDDEIALLGEFFSKESQEFAQAQSKVLFGKEYMQRVGDINEIAAIRTAGKRGEYFRVIDRDGCILFDEYVNLCGILMSRGKTHGYVFLLKDYKATQEFDMFFDEDAECPAVVVYMNNKLYSNNITDKEVSKKFEFDKSIEIEVLDSTTYKLLIRGHRYNSLVIDNFNNIYCFEEVYMRV